MNKKYRYFKNQYETGTTFWRVDEDGNYETLYHQSFSKHTDWIRFSNKWQWYNDSNIPEITEEEMFSILL